MWQSRAGSGLGAEMGVKPPALDVTMTDSASRAVQMSTEYYWKMSAGGKQTDVLTRQSREKNLDMMMWRQFAFHRQKLNDLYFLVAVVCLPEPFCKDDEPHVVCHYDTYKNAFRK